MERTIFLLLRPPSVCGLLGLRDQRRLIQKLTRMVGALTVNLIFGREEMPVHVQALCTHVLPA